MWFASLPRTYLILFSDAISSKSVEERGVLNQSKRLPRPPLQSPCSNPSKFSKPLRDIATSLGAKCGNFSIWNGGLGFPCGRNQGDVVLPTCPWLDRSRRVRSHAARRRYYDRAALGRERAPRRPQDQSSPKLAHAWAGRRRARGICWSCAWRHCFSGAACWPKEAPWPPQSDRGEDSLWERAVQSLRLRQSLLWLYVSLCRWYRR